MTPAELILWQGRMGFSVKEAVEALGIKRRTYEKWRAGETKKIPTPIVKLTTLLEQSRPAA